eukprot:scaffold287994_cov21-Tisochrysis_lutea.AAC.1
MVPEKGAKEFKDDSSDDAPKQAEKVSEAVPSADIEHQGPPCAQDHGHKHGTICVHGHGHVGDVAAYGTFKQKVRC